METIEPHFAWPLKVAALRLGVGETALKWYYLDSKNMKNFGMISV